MLDKLILDCKEKANAYRAIAVLADSLEFRSKYAKAPLVEQNYVTDLIDKCDRRRLRGWLIGRPSGETMRELRARASALGISYVCQKTAQKLRMEIQEHDRRSGKPVA